MITVHDFFAFDVQRVVPHHMGCVTERFAIIGIVTLEYADRLEPVRQVKPDRLVARLALHHGLQVIVRIRVRASATRVSRHASAEDDAFQIESFPQCLAGRVKTSANPQSPMRRIDADFHAVQIISVRVVARGETVDSDVAPAVRFQ